MRHDITNRRRYIVWVGLLALALTVAATPVGRSATTGALMDIVEIPEKAARFPSWIVDHSSRYFLARPSPVCPQCI